MTGDQPLSYEPQPPQEETRVRDAEHSSWQVGDVVTSTRRGFKPRQFEVTSVDDTRPGEVSYSMRPIDGSYCWERA